MEAVINQGHIAVAQEKQKFDPTGNLREFPIQRLAVVRGCKADVMDMKFETAKHLYNNKEYLEAAQLLVK